MSHKKTVVVGMSGGVDSSTSAYLLKKQGYNVIGVFLNFWFEASPIERRSMNDDRCCSVDGQADARRVARVLGIPFYTLNFSKIFKERVVDHFVSEFRKGNTPNPCVTCNKHIKFGEFITKSQEIFNADYIATGHYAQVKQNKQGAYSLHQGVDEIKDQTYFLYNLSQKDLARVMFPVGEIPKEDVKKIAREQGLVRVNKTESQGLCFLREENHYNFLKNQIAAEVTSGDIVDEQGVVLGRHDGLPLYTVGQRKGINLGGNGPYYVVGFDREKNILFVSNNRFSPQLYTQNIYLRDEHWISGNAPQMPFDCLVRYRHGQKPVPAILQTLSGSATINLKEPQRAVMSGQSAVVYKDGEVIGGGIIYS